MTDLIHQVTQLFSIDYLIQYIEWGARLAPTWGFFLIFFFMTVESSFIPFPSEVVMIPAGFLAFRGELTFHAAGPDLTLAIIAGLLGSLAGAYINYYLALYLGRPVLYRWGRYFFLPAPVLTRAEQVFNEYGDITTFVCRLLPAIRQLISIPAGLAKMPFGRFTFFTGLGAGIWTAILAFVGYYLGSLSADMSYADLVHKGKTLIQTHYIWIFIGLAMVIIVYLFIHRKVMALKPESVPTKD